MRTIFILPNKMIKYVTILAIAYIKFKKIRKQIKITSNTF